MANGASLPLFGPQVDIESKNAKALAALAGLVAVARVSPGAAGRGLSALLGVAPATATAGASVTPLFITNALPQPLGFVPPENYGLAPNFYLPGTLGAGLPNWFPGAAEQTALRDQRNQQYADDRRRAEALRYGQLFPTLPSTELIGYIHQASDPATNYRYADPVGVIALAQGVIDQRTAARLREEAANAIAPTMTNGVTAVPIDPSNVLPNGFIALPQSSVTTGGAATSGGNGGVTTGVPQTSTTAPGGAPGHFPDQQIGGAATGAVPSRLDSFKAKFPGLIGAQLPDGFFAAAANDPWTGIS